MNLILFIVMVVTSFLVVRVGAVAFHLTGLEWSLAKFQALSCFSGTGFTTKEAELITGHSRRRQIAGALMVLGNAGLVTLIATFANSIKPSTLVRPADIGFLRPVHPLINLVVIVGVLYLTYRFFTRASIAQRMTDYIRQKLQRSRVIEPVSFEELLVSTGGYGITRIQVGENSPLANANIASSGLREKDITVLVVRHKDQTIPNPPAETTVQQGDVLLCFGRLDHMKEEFNAVL